jgi:hypothetical protein
LVEETSFIKGTFIICSVNVMAALVIKTTYLCV